MTSSNSTHTPTTTWRSAAVLDTAVLARNELGLALRNRLGLAIGLVQPVVYLLVFGPLLRQAIPGRDPWLFLVPGLLLQLSLFGAGFAGFNLIPDIRAGYIDRLRVAPISRTSILLGRVIKDAIVLVVQTIPLLALGYLSGMRANPVGVFATLPLLLLAGVGLASLSYALALSLPSEYLFAPAVNSAAVPLMLLSGILLPLTHAPAWLTWLSRLDPLRYTLDATRGLFTGTVDTTAVTGGCVTLAFAALAFALSAQLFQRHTR